LIGTGEQRGWSIDAERIGGVEVEDQVEFGRLLDRNIAG
jgi:hypothetical protein